MDIPSIRQARDIGVRGGLKSLYHSLRHTGRPTSFVITSQVITEIHPKTSFEINERFAVGAGRYGASHPKISRSKVSTAADALLAHTGEEMAILGPGSVLHVEGEFSMGDSYVNSHARIMCGDEILIGDDVAIAWNVQLLDDDRHALRINGDPVEQTAPIHIEDNVWIGHDVSIHKGVTVHEGSVVASDSVVTSDVPSNTVVAGVPAEVVREGISWGKDDTE